MLDLLELELDRDRVELVSEIEVEERRSVGLPSSLTKFEYEVEDGGAVM